MYFLQQVPVAMNRFHDCHVFQIFNLHSVVCFIQLPWILPQVHVAMYTVHCTLYRCHNFHVFQIFTRIMSSVTFYVEDLVPLTNSQWRCQFSLGRFANLSLQLQKQLNTTTNAASYWQQNCSIIFISGPRIICIKDMQKVSIREISFVPRAPHLFVK